ncbi:SMP-30/gluconolactonase/LRE family protein [Hyphococcus flavus]|uniref:SMP-30/gluconolactonase/LRE family protein n=1 Tax=Hyphococcus flavus TaxID=1866326 RepID=A0AAE9ZIT6_9PROT|nr:SMP-30/gluconolactonase/LRE family protein [Hyphococcus flavus]WDI31155.1 SMP-30/gluconolactonase/LRE family protein [Hyphococcus flavus]
MRYIIGGVVLLLIAAVGWSILHIVPASGINAELNTRLADQCARVDIAPGTEDVTIDAELGLAFISAADRRAWFQGGEGAINPQNGIYAMTLDGASVRRVSPPMDNFLPHGISLWRGDDGSKRLFVVNHPPSGEETVEIFDIGANGDLTHVETISFPAMKSPNDLVAVGPRQFYVTNDKGFKNRILGTIEGYLALPLASVAYFDGENGRIVKGGIAYANGINKSADGAAIYVAELLKRRVLVFERNPETNALKRIKTLKVDTAPDNIEVSQDGALWVAGHSKIFEFLNHAKDENTIAPSHVVRVNPRNGVTSDVLISINGEINGSSVGAVWANTLIVGAVFDGHVLVCPMLEILLRGRPAET